MDLETFRDYCLAKPGAVEDTPFGPETLVFKVGGKIFAITSLDDLPTKANLKCDPDLALDLRDRYEQVRPGYHMNKKHWNTVEIEGGIPVAEIRKMIDHSYELVLKTLPASRNHPDCRARVSDATSTNAAAPKRPTAARKSRPGRYPTAKRRGRR